VFILSGHGSPCRYANLWYFKTHYRFGSEALLDLAMANILYDTQV
jgi:hypothetical protein